MRIRRDPTLGEPFQSFPMFWWDNIPKEHMNTRDGGNETSNRARP